MLTLLMVAHGACFSAEKTKFMDPDQGPGRNDAVLKVDGAPLRDGPLLPDAARDLPRRDASPPQDSQQRDGPALEARPLDAPARDVSADGGTLPDTGVVYAGTLPSGPRGDVISGTLTVNGVARNLSIYIPQNVQPNPPLVLTFHGTNGDSSGALWAAEGHFLADAEGVVVIAPQARTMTVADWDAHYPGDVYWESYPYTTLQNNEDLQLVVAIIEAAKQAYNVDPKRVYSMGVSGGAFFAMVAGFALPYRIAALAEVNAGLVRCANLDLCWFTSPSQSTSCSVLSSEPGWCNCSGDEKPIAIPTTGRKVPVYMTHASTDQAISVYYACQFADRLTALGYHYVFDLHTNPSHDWPASFGPTIWTQFFSKHQLP